jgi:hypothetical protein
MKIENAFHREIWFYLFQLSDEPVLRKRVDVAENRNQDLLWLLREKQSKET